MISARQVRLIIFAIAAVVVVSVTAIVVSAQTQTDEPPTMLNVVPIVAALNAQEATLAGDLSNDELLFGFGYGAWYGYWEDVSAEEALAYLLARSVGGRISAETLPDEPVDFLNGSNPLRDLMPDHELDSVLLVRGWDGNSDAEALFFMSPTEEGSELLAVAYSRVGFRRVSRY